MPNSRAKKKNSIEDFYKLLFIFCIFLFILFQSISYFIFQSKDFSNIERRKYNQFRNIDYDIYDMNLILKIENALKDQYVFRNNFLYLKSQIVKLFKNNYKNGVYILDNKFVEEEVYPNYDIIASKTSNLLQELNDIKAYVYFFMFPNACSIYKEDLPMWSKNSYQKDVFDLLNNTYEKSLINFVDTTKMLNEIKNDLDNLYYNTDHHLKSDTMYLIKDKIFEILHIEDNYSYHKVQLNDNFKGSLMSKSGVFNDFNDELNVYLIDENIHYIVTNYDKNLKSASIYNFDKINSYDPYLCFVGDNSSLITIKTEFYNKKRLLIIKDSYANCFIPFLIPFYSEIDIVDPRYISKKLGDVVSFDEYDEVILFHNLNTYMTK